MLPLNIELGEFGNGPAKMVLQILCLFAEGPIAAV
jgi:hypothetical protein